MLCAQPDPVDVTPRDSARHLGHECAEALKFLSQLADYFVELGLWSA